MESRTRDVFMKIAELENAKRNSYKTISGFKRNLIRKILPIIELEKQKFERTRGLSSIRDNIDYNYLCSVETSLKESIIGKEKKDIVSVTLDNKLIKLLMEIGFTNNQSRVYTYMIQAKQPVTAPELFNTLKIPRTETYHLISSLMNLELIDRDPMSLLGRIDNTLPTHFFTIKPIIAIKNLFDRKFKKQNKAKGEIISYLEHFKLG